MKTEVGQDQKPELRQKLIKAQGIIRSSVPFNLSMKIGI